MAKKRTTSQQVAERAGVSRTTVSFVLNNVPGTNISDETRKRVLRAAHDLGYVPNELARSLVSGQTHNVGLVICQPRSQFLTDAFMPHVIHGVSEIAKEHGFQLLIDWVEDSSQPDAYLNLSLAQRIDGMLLCGPRVDDKQLPALIEDGFPVVVIGSLPEIPAYLVAVNERLAAQQAVAHLIELGHERIACISNSPIEYFMSSERVTGYKDAMRAAGLKWDARWIQYGNFDPESGYTAMQSLFGLEVMPTAVFVASDVVAFGAMGAILNRNLRIPGDIAIVGFDDVSMSPYVYPALTTMHLPAIEQGKLATCMLIDLIQGETPDHQQVIMETRLVVRHSCGAQ
jgi:DNA-binding LacI/PurR family transcriptional regulator